MDYIQDISEQVRRVYNDYHYLNRLRESLRMQGRIYVEVREREVMRNPFYFGDMDFSRFYVGNSGTTTGTFISSSSLQPKKYINTFNYKPEYIKHYMLDEDPETTLLLGAEIEVDCGGESEEHAKKVLKIMCGHGVNPDDQSETIVLEDKMYCTHDGSLNAGIEFDTMPCSLEYHKKEMNYKEMFKYLDNNGYKAHDTDTCGLHIHADRKYLGKSELMQQLTISKILYILEKFNDEICVIARRDNSYSKFVGKDEKDKSLNKLYNKYHNAGKKVALNLQHDESIEFRCFKGTLKYETFILTLEFVKDIIDYAKSVNIEEIELIKWSDLMDTFSDELKEYYNDRLKKERKKKDKTTIKIVLDNDTSSSSDITCSNNLMSFTSVISNLVRPSVNANLQSIDEDIINRAIRTEFGRIISTSYDSLDSLGTLRLEPLHTRDTRERERTIVEELKDKEKTLKKQIKNSNNYMEKNRLKKELNKLQKEIKKEKKKEKLCNNTLNSN